MQYLRLQYPTSTSFSYAAYKSLGEDWLFSVHNIHVNNNFLLPVHTFTKSDH